MAPLTRGRLTAGGHPQCPARREVIPTQVCSALLFLVVGPVFVSLCYFFLVSQTHLLHMSISFSQGYIYGCINSFDAYEGTIVCVIFDKRVCVSNPALFIYKLV